MNEKTVARTGPVVLQAIADKRQSNALTDTKEELLAIPNGCTVENVITLVQSVMKLPAYFIWCADTLQMWCTQDEDSLHRNFVYQGDLEIAIVQDVEGLAEYYAERAANVKIGVTTSKRCFILNNPVMETYEVYYASNYPLMRYGKVTPDGMTVMSFKDRFERDVAILELEEHYTSQSKKSAQSIFNRKLNPTEAIVVSDGCLNQGAGACAVMYMDSFGIQKQSRSFAAVSGKTSPLIPELEGALMAFRICYGNKKKQITYCCDNLSVIDIVNGKTMKDVKVAMKLRNLLDKLVADGCTINCIAVHPKNKGKHGTMDKAIVYLHNVCDKECTIMTDLYSSKN